jgi:quercetin dioxygenase-like cupin family protein
MPIINIKDAKRDEYDSGRVYETLVGDDEGSTPVRVGIQTSPPGYSTGTHVHPYMEVITVIEGVGEAWIGEEDDFTPIGPGSTIVAPAHAPHGFRNTGDTPMRSYGVHASPTRITFRDGHAPAAGMAPRDTPTS